MKRNWVLAALAAFLLLVVSLLAFHLHYEGIQEVRSQFEKHQLSYANHLANQIQFFIQARSRGLKALSSFASLQFGEATQLKLDMNAYAKEIGNVYVKQTSLYDKTGMAVYSTDPATIGLKKGKDKFFVWARRGENRDRILLSPVFPDPQFLTFLLATPLYQETLDSKYPSPSGKFVGVLTFTLDMKEFLANQLGSIDPQLDLNQVWIIDKDGTLLFQPDHPEMVSRNIYQEQGSCRSCHISFSYVEEILTKRHGVIDYRIENHPQKIAAFASMEFEDVAWVVVVNTPYDKVTGFIKKSLREHLFLIGIAIIAFAIGSILTVRNERMKIKAENEVMRWQEKMAERKKAEEGLELERDKLKGILDSMNDGVYIVNQEYEVVYANPVFERERGPVNKRKCYEYLLDLPGVCSWCKNEDVFAGETVLWEWHSSKTGKTYEIFDTPFVGPDGALCKLGIVRDISDRKKADEALKESEKQLRALSFQLLTAQETERKRISRELHDELGQALTVLKLRMNFIEKNLLEHQSKLKEECDYGVQYIDQVIENVRRLSRDLSPTILEDFGLSAALRWLVSNFAKSYNIRVNLDMIDIDPLLPRNSYVVIYRTVQEALTNIGKHSRANNVSIVIQEGNGTVSFSIEDDGKGFDERKTAQRGPEETGLGLATMKGRARMLEGIFDIRTEEGKGTRITLSIPVKRGVTLS
jgi:signal transduction histidine kinase